MNVSDAVRQRRSVRDFRPDPVPKALLAEVLDAARWAPSGSNIQAWRIVAVTGAARDAIVEMTRSAVSAPGFGKSADPWRSINWWRRRESNPRPQALDFRIYARSSLIESRLALPEEQGRRSASTR